MNKENNRTLQLPARLENLELLVDFVLESARRDGLGKEGTAAVHLAVDEACTNIINYAYPPDNPGTIEIECRRLPESFVVFIRDQGLAFDPTRAAPPGLEQDISLRPVGGLGIFLMKKSLDGLSYRRGENGNELTMIKKLPGPKQ